MPNNLFTSETAPRNGRPKGAKNRTTEETRQLIQDIVNKNLDTLEQDLAGMSPTNRWIVLEKLTKYFLPALSKNDNNTTYQGAMKIVVEYQNALKPGLVELNDCVVPTTLAYTEPELVEYRENPEGE